MALSGLLVVVAGLGACGVLAAILLAAGWVIVSERRSSTRR